MNVPAEHVLKDAGVLVKQSIMILGRADELFEVLSKVNEPQAAKLRHQLRLALVNMMAALTGNAKMLEELSSPKVETKQELATP